MKKLLAIPFLLISLPSFAASLESEYKVQDIWNYTFSVKSSKLSLSTPLAVSEFDCNTPVSRKTGEPMFRKPSICFNTAEEARIDAQKKADKFEQDLIKRGLSTTVMEAKRKLAGLGK